MCVYTKHFKAISCGRQPIFESLYDKIEKHWTVDRSFPQIEGVVLFTACTFGASSKAKPKFLVLIIQKATTYREREGGSVCLP